MNHSFKSVFNRRTGTWQVTSEKTRSAGKTGNMVSKPLLTMLLGLYAGAGMAQTSPIDGGQIETITSTWNVGGDLSVGHIHTGTLIIKDGGKVSNTFAYIGRTGTGTGTVIVTGTNSIWENSAEINMGVFGSATLTIEDGAKVTSSYLSLWSAGSNTLNLNGTSGARGLLAVNSLSLNSNTSQFNWNGGILQATGAQNNFLQNSGSSNITIGSNGAYFDTNGYNVGIATAGLLTGGGGLTKQGGGVLTIAGSNTYAGSTTVSQGTLRFDTYIQSASQALGIGVTSLTNYGKLDVTGVATFDTNAKLNVEVASAPTLANGTILTDVIRAGTLTANGFNVTDNSALFNFEAIRNANSVDLKVRANSSSGILAAVTEGGQWFALGAASVLDAQVNNGGTSDMGTVVTALGQLTNNRDVARATAQTLPVISGNQAVQGALSTFQNLVQNRNSSDTTGLSGGDAFANKNAWGKVFGSRAEQDNRSGAAGFTADTWGLALGADAEVASEARFGVAYGYAKTSVDGNTNLSGAAQRANIDSHVISAYGSKDIGGNRTFSFQGDIGLNDSKSTRDIEFGGLKRTARADYRTYSAHVGAALAQAFELSEKTTLTPALRADYTWLKSQAYSESGADALNLNVGSNKTDAFVIGADAYLQHRFSNTSRFDANFGVGYDTINKQGSIVAAYAGAPGQSFLTTGIDHSPWLMRGGIGYSMLASNGTEVSFRYDAEGRSDYLNHTASVKAKWAF
ncbi:Outer membrane protein B precursor [compost metagenome]